jgi:predicted enzyme related to lactoylglutathione lyase
MTTNTVTNMVTDATADALLQAGAEALDAPRDVGAGIVVAAVKDPFGNRLGVISNPHFDVSKVR